MFGFARKWLAYHVKEHTDPSSIRHIKEVGDVCAQHSAELEECWRLTSPDECAGLMIAFLDELRHDWPREFLQLRPEGLPATVSEGLKGSIKQAYFGGFMLGQGWISKEQETDFGIYLGDKLAGDVRAVFKGVKSKGIAFACGFTAVSVRGYLKAAQQATTPTLTQPPALTPAPGEGSENCVTEGSDATTAISPWEREPDCTDTINGALELLETRRHLPGIDAKELALLLAYFTKLTLLLNGEMALGELLVQEKLSLLRAESLREGSKEDRHKLREQIDLHKARLQKIVEEDREKVTKILADAGLAELKGG